MPIGNRLKEAFKRLSRSTDGNVAVITALTITPMIALACGSVDVMRVTTAHHKLQAALDSATLASASLTNTNEINDTITDYIDANLPNGAPWDTLSVTTELVNNQINSKTVTITASVNVNTPFLSLAGTDSIDIAATSTATQSATNIEISMVLDISSSMSGSKLTNLRSASTEFIDLMLKDDNVDYTSINLIPFGGTVNIGASLFARYANPSGGSTITNPNQNQYYKNKNTPYGKYLFTNGDTCIEYTNADFDLEDIPTGSRAQLPYFVRYRPDNNWCPKPTTIALLNTNNATDLKNTITAMELSDGTGMDIGALWGGKALSPSLRGVIGGDFADRPADFDDEETIKIAIIMTDGEITNQTRPRYADPTKKNDIRDKRDPRQTVVGAGGQNTASSKADDAVAYFKRMCEAMKANGIQVYTIGFNIKLGNKSDYLLQYCASSLNNYYFVEGLNLEEAFRSIAVSVNSLRVSG